MTRSYLIDFAFPQSIFYKNTPDLFDLIRLSLFAFGLQIDNLGKAIPGENVMITPHPFSKTKGPSNLQRSVNSMFESAPPARTFSLSFEYVPIHKSLFVVSCDF